MRQAKLHIGKDSIKMKTGEMKNKEKPKTQHDRFVSQDTLVIQCIGKKVFQKYLKIQFRARCICAHKLVQRVPKKVRFTFLFKPNIAYNAREHHKQS